jgi:hypothetical protein
MNKTVSVFGFLACFLISSGTLFKIMHWPSASIMLVLGFVFLNFGVLPAYFYSKYKQA